MWPIVFRSIIHPHNSVLFSIVSSWQLLAILSGLLPRKCTHPDYWENHALGLRLPGQLYFGKPLLSLRSDHESSSVQCSTSCVTCKWNGVQCNLETEIEEITNECMNLKYKHIWFPWSWIWFSIYPLWCMWADYHDPQAIASYLNFGLHSLKF